MSKNLKPVNELFIPDDWFYISKHSCGSTIDFFIKRDRETTLRYEYYIRCVKNRAKAYMKTWCHRGYPLIDLIFSGKFDEHGCRNKEGMQQLRYECFLGKHYL